MNPAGVIQLQQVFERVIQAAVGLGLMALVVMLAYGGVRYITSGGDPKQIQPASQTLTYAVAGIALLALAWIILKIIDNYTTFNLLDFCIGFRGLNTNNCPL